MRRSTLMVLCAIAACGGDQRAADSTANTSAPAVLPARDSTTPPTLYVTETGIGPVRAGMTLAELRQALDSVRFTDPDSMRCAYPKFSGLPDGVWVMVEQSVVGRVDVQKGDVATAEGAKIGDTEAKVRATYGARVSSEPHKYTDGRYLIVKPASGDTTRLIIFETNVEGTVLRYRAGKLPQVRYVESCS